MNIKNVQIVDVATTIMLSLLAITFPLGNKFSILSLWGVCFIALLNEVFHRHFSFRPIYIILLMMFSLRIIGILSSKNTPFSCIEQSLSLLIIPICLSAISFSKKQIICILHAICYGYILLSGLIILSYIVNVHCNSTDTNFLQALSNPKLYYSHFLIPPFWWHPSFISVALSFFIPLGFYLRFETNKISRTTLTLGILIVIFAIYIMGARIAIWLIGILLILQFIGYRKKISRVSKILGIASIALIAILIANYSSLELSSDGIRSQLLHTGWTVFKQTPWFGSNVCSMGTYINSESLAHSLGYSNAFHFNHFHNQFLDELVQFGIIGAIPLFALFIYLTLLAIRHRDLLLINFLFIYFLFFNVESPIASIKGIMPCIFWLCFIISTQKLRLQQQL
ncbi:MAG: O-antigen ligase family protein [Bacteroidales bacterium]